MEETLDLFFSKPGGTARVAYNWKKKFVVPVFYKEKTAWPEFVLLGKAV